MTRSSNEAISCDRLKSISLWWSLILHWGSTHVTTLRTAHLMTAWAIWWNFMWNLVYSKINFQGKLVEFFSENYILPEQYV